MYIRTQFLTHITFKEVNRNIISLQEKLIENKDSASFEKPC